MSASFRRKKLSDNAIVGLLKGSKHWTGGITLTSVGLRDLDAILGGGQPFATSLLLEEDRWTRDLSLCLIKYWCAEAVSHEQSLLIPSFQGNESGLPTSAPSLVEEREDTIFIQGASKSQINQLIDSLPRNLNWDKAAGRVAVLEEQNTSSRPLEILEEEEDEDAEEGLQIAWQYRKSIQSERLGQKSMATPSPPATSTANTYCHSFDLNGRLSDQDMNRKCIEIFDAHCDVEGDLLLEKRNCGWILFHTLKKQIQSQPKGKVIRLLLYQAPVEASSIAVPLLLSYIRSEALPVVLMVTVHPWTCGSESSLVNLRRACDVVLQTEGFASRVHYPPPAEFQHLQGLLLLPKVSTSGMNHFADATMSKRPPANVYGLKRDRRKLHMPLLHIPPEDYAGEGGSVAGGGVRSGAGRRSDKQSSTSGCSSNGNSKLDF